MLNYQTTSFHDALYVRKVLGLKPAPEFEDWLKTSGIFEDTDALKLATRVPTSFARALAHL
jgi:ethanolamine ammonia-lyase large subunit